MDQTTFEANLKPFLLILLVSLSAATLPQIFGWFRRIPYTLLLVMIGLALAGLDVRFINLSPSLILLVFLPPLLFEAAWSFHWRDLKRHLLPISLYAVFGVLISIAGVAIGLAQLTGISLTTALLIGACLSSTDPISVTALFRELGVNKQLITLLEGESLFNDGTAVVAFGIFSGLAFGTVKLTASSFVLQLLTVIGIGIGTGVLIGFGISYLTQRFELPQVEQSLTLVAAYGSYIIADDLGGSGVLAVVTTGLILGNFGSRIGMNPRTRIIVGEFWNFLAFLVNSIVFLVIGDQIRFNLLRQNIGAIAITIIVMILARAIAVYGLSFLSNLFTPFNIQRKNQTVLWWGGLRGSVTIALALSVPTQLSDRSMIISIVFGVVLFTLLVQGLTIQSFVQKLQLLDHQQELQQHYQEMMIRQIALNRALERLQTIGQRLSLAPDVYHAQEAEIQAELDRLHHELTILQNQYRELRHVTAEQLRAELALTELETYTEFVRQGRLDQTLPPFLKRFSKQ
ncbi:Na+/H+ antiporter [Pseudanabaenaceae cyanobacterium LEGE 13415]|nr:Na+/H+ antiporter [Pseudanabaenaceae cyanobacterium LEGE 13415]